MLYTKEQVEEERARAESRAADWIAALCDLHEALRAKVIELEKREATLGELLTDEQIKTFSAILERDEARTVASILAKVVDDLMDLSAENTHEYERKHMAILNRGFCARFDSNNKVYSWIEEEKPKEEK